MCHGTCTVLSRQLSGDFSHLPPRVLGTKAAFTTEPSYCPSSRFERGSLTNLELIHLPWQAVQWAPGIHQTPLYQCCGLQTHTSVLSWCVGAGNLSQVLMFAGHALYQIQTQIFQAGEMDQSLWWLPPFIHSSGISVMLGTVVCGTRNKV